MSDFATYCAVSGLCYNLASQFIVKVPWQNVIKDVILNSGKKVWSNRNSFKLVLKEAQMAQQIYHHFSDTVRKLDDYQKSIDIPICSLETAKTFLVDFKSVLEIYDPKNLSDWEQNTAGDALRQQLQYYIAYMHSIMGNIHLELSYVNLQLQTIQMEKDPMRRTKLIQNLKRGCTQRYSASTLIPNGKFEQSKHENVENDDNDDLYSDAEEGFEDDN